MLVFGRNYPGFGECCGLGILILGVVVWVWIVGSKDGELI